ncbi:MAG: ABC transporter permease [Gammaproteobacteria bacterium]
MILKLTQTFLRMFFRDRRAIMFSLMFPLVFMFIFGFTGNIGPERVAIGIADNANNALSASFIAALKANPAFDVIEGSEGALRELVLTGDVRMALIVPPSFQDNGEPTALPVVVDTTQVRELGLLMPVLEKALIDAEHALRGTDALFTLAVEDVQARAQNYLAFVIPGLLAMSLMSISIAGSGFNIVEFRRKGILKRLFVTPLEPKHFIGGLVLSRTIICVIQLSVVLAVGVFVLGLDIAGDFLSLYAVMLMGIAVFLGIGFCLGSLAKSQEAIQGIANLVTLPQMLLSGVFFSIDSLPDFIEPFAQALPLSFVANGMRAIIVDGASLLDLGPTLLGLAVWAVISIGLAIRMFVWKEVAV